MANPGACRGKGGADGMGREAAARAARRCTVASRAVRVQRPSITRRQTDRARIGWLRGKGSIAAMSAAAAAIAAAPITAACSGRSPPRLHAAAAALADSAARWPAARGALPSAALPFAWLRQIVGTAFRPLHGLRRLFANLRRRLDLRARRLRLAALRQRGALVRARAGAAGVLVRTRRGAGAAEAGIVVAIACGPAPGLGPPSGREPAPGPGPCSMKARGGRPWLCSKNCPRSAPAERAKLRGGGRGVGF